MPKVADPLNNMSQEKRRQVEILEEECNEILDELFCTPGDESLYRKLREIELKIVTLTGETAMDYTLSSLSNT